MDNHALTGALLGMAYYMIGHRIMVTHLYHGLVVGSFLGVSCNIAGQLKQQEQRDVYQLARETYGHLTNG